MNLGEMLDEIKRKARKDPELRRMLLAAREQPCSLSAFCAVCRQQGYPVYEMDLIE